jgi:hypothetical protein
MCYLCEKYAPLESLGKYDPQKDPNVTGSNIQEHTLQTPLERSSVLEGWMSIFGRSTEMEVDLYRQNSRKLGLPNSDIPDFFQEFQAANLHDPLMCKKRRRCYSGCDGIEMLP